jgi:hypothetical protein
MTVVPGCSAVMVTWFVVVLVVIDATEAVPTE